MELATLHDLLRCGRVQVSKYLSSVKMTTRVELACPEPELVSGKGDGIE